MAPTGPITSVQNTTDKNVSVRLSDTASLTNFGCTSTCSTTLMTL